MTKMIIPITRVRGNAEIAELLAIPKISAIFALALLSAALAGVLVGAILQLKETHTPNPILQTATVGNFEVTPNDAEALRGVGPRQDTLNAPPGTGEANDQRDAETANTQIPISKRERDIEENARAISISIHQTAITEISREIELITNESVALVAEFDRNCGSWEDRCAETYTQMLETNNTRHDELIARLTILAQERTIRESDLVTRE